MQENLTAKFSLLIVLIVGVWGAYAPVARINLERQEAYRMLQETVTAIQRNLPAPNDPKRQQKMPVGINPYLRKGLRYYPERDAYKYTFNRKYEQDHRGQPGRDSGIPEPLEQRSIWWKVIDGRWHCYAGIKKHVRQELCGKRAILNGLTVREHQDALWINNHSGLAYWLRSLQLPYNTQIYYLTKDTKEADIRLNSVGRDVILILKSRKSDDIWHIQHAPNTHIRAVIAEGRGQHIYGLPPQTPVFDYSVVIKQCDKEDRHCGSFPDSDSLRQMIGLGSGNVIYEKIEETLKAPLQIGIDPQQSWISFPTMIQIGLSNVEPIRLVEENSGIDSTNTTEIQEK